MPSLPPFPAPAMYKKLFEALGLGHLFDPSKAEGKKQSRYITVDGKPITKKGLRRHERVIDTWSSKFKYNDINNPEAISWDEVSSPQQDMMPGLPILPTPIGNLVETAAGAAAEVHPLLGLLTGVVAGRFDSGLSKRIPSDAYGGGAPKIQTYGKYAKPSDHTSYNDVDKLVSQWVGEDIGGFQGIIDLIAQGNIRGSVIKLGDFQRSGASIGQGVHGLSQKIPFWNQSNQKLINMPISEYRQRLLDMGEDFPALVDNTPYPGFGNLRIANKGGYTTQFGDIDARMADIDIPDAQHFTKEQVTAMNLGEVLERVLKYQKDINPYSLMDIGVTPGGFRLFDISNLARIEQQGPRAIQKHLKFLEDIKSDPLYRNFEQNRMRQTLGDVWDQKYPHKISAYDKGVSLRKTELDEIGGTVPMGFGNIHGATMPNIPIPKALYDLWRKKGMFSAVRLQAKPGRVQALEKGNIGYGTEKPPFTYQHMLTLGDPNYMNPTSMSAVDIHNSIITNMRKAQGLSDPIRPDLGLGFTSSQYIDPILESVPPAYKKLINQNLKFGLAGPGLLHMATPEEEPAF
jgi:hypothetical protein